MPRLEDLDSDSREFILNYKCVEGPDVPSVHLGKPLDKCRISLITSSGLHLRTDRPFDLGNPDGDPTFRVIPANVAASDLTLSIISANWDRTGFAMDLNVVFPIERLRELAAEGILGAVADEHYAFMGSIFNVDPVLARSAPEVGRRLAAAGVDAGLLVPV